MAWKTSAKIKSPRRTKRDLWVGFKPYGMGETKPNHYKEMLKTVWDNRDNLPYAWRILNRGVCDGCALGVAGFHDWTLSGVHLCTTRLNLLRVNTMGALDPAVLADVAPLRRLRGKQLRDLGRLAHPMVRRRGEAGFTQVTWDEALDLVAGRIRASTPDRLAVYLTARGITNETYYVAQKVTRFLGTNNIDNAARVCHAPSTTTLKRTIGVAATTCSYTDVINSDLIVLFGSNVANGQPVFMKYLYLARKRGAKVAVVNPLREPGLDRYWVPSNVESAMFGTHMTDEFFAVNTGGDLAFVNGVLKVMLEEGTVDRDFVRDHTEGFDAVVEELERETFADLERQSGTTRADMERFARMYGAAPSAVLIWSMGITQHERGADTVAAIVNLGLARGNVGRPGAGLMPIRGHSGVQGGSEMGGHATAFPGGIEVNPASAANLAEQYGFPIGDRPGMTAEEMVEAGGRGDLDVLYSSGGNFLEVLPDPELVEQLLARVPVRVHQDIVLSSQMLVDPGEVVVLLPAATRYEQRGGGTETTTERRIAFSPEIAGGRPGEVRSEWEIFVDLAARVDPARAELVAFASGQAIRDEIARVVPTYSGVEVLRTTGDAVQWGGTRLCEGGMFPTADGKARFLVVAPSEPDVPEGSFVLSTRRGKQFNTMVHAERDPLTGAMRDALFMAPSDIAGLGLRDGDRVVIRSDHGEMAARLHASEVRPGNVQVFFPEGNVLLRAGRRDPASGVPDYNAVVTVEAAAVSPDAIGPNAIGPNAIGPNELLALFDVASAAQRGALATLGPAERRARTDRPGQYQLDVVADAAVLPVLASAGVRVLSEESGWSGPADAELTVVLDPVDGSTNCARRLPYWAISLCALDAQGPLCALVQNGATGARYTAIRGGGAWLDGVALAPSATTDVERALVALSGWPPRPLAWRQFRALGSAALALCDVAAGHIDGYLDGHADQHAPWDYLGAYLVCVEAGAPVVDAVGRDLVALDADTRRQLIAAGTPDLLAELLAALHEGLTP